MKKRLSIISIIIVCFFVPVGGTAFAFNQIVAFGDSLSDNGNVSYATNYWDGQGVWVEYLASEMDAVLDNNAIGGATTSGVYSQVSAYLGEVTIVPSNKRDTLFTIWAGGNDILGKLLYNVGGDNFIAEGIGNVEASIRDLIDAGAKDILVLNLPDLGAIPAFYGNATGAYWATLFTQMFNDGLLQMLCGLKVEFPEVRLYMGNAYELMDYIVAFPEKFGFTNVQTFPFVFDWTGYAFFDYIHPTTAAHEIVAAIACGQVYHRNLSKPMRELLRKLNKLRPRQPLEYDCDICCPAP